MTTLIDLGNAVQIYGTVIPAVNIQVENFPKFIELKHGDGTVSREWFGIYFEIMIEDGSLWVVECGTMKDDRETIVVTSYPRWVEDAPPEGITNVYIDWNDFLGAYETKKKLIEDSWNLIQFEI